MTRRRFVLALIGALIASLSSLSGLLVWGAFLPAVWATGRARAGGWVAVALALGVPYFIGFPGGSAGARSPVQTVSYGLAYLGAPIGYVILPLAVAFGVLGLVLMVAALFVLWRVQPKRVGDRLPELAWTGLALFGVGCAGLAALGRTMDFGVRGALGTRYHAFTSLWWVALMVLAGLAATRLEAALPSFAAPNAARARWAVRAGATVLALARGGLLAANLVGFYHSIK